MLNELLIAERGAGVAGLRMVPRHTDIVYVGRMPMLLVRLGKKGIVASVQPLPESVRAWTLRDGNHNSFPSVKAEMPLWALSADHAREVLAAKGDALRRVLLKLAENTVVDDGAFSAWPGAGLLNRIEERRQSLQALKDTEGEILLSTIERFLLACQGGALLLLRAVADGLLEGLRKNPQASWLEAAASFLVGQFDPKQRESRCVGAFLFEPSEGPGSIADGRLISVVSAILADEPGATALEGQCALTGRRQELIDVFPHPTIHSLGITYLFARNSDIPATGRYGLFAGKAMPVARDTANRLAAALEALTGSDLEGKTWRTVPSEKPNQSDLLLAFVEASLDAPVVSTVAEDGIEQQDSSDVRSDSVAEFEKRTERVIEAVRARIGADFRKTPVRLAIFRKVDTGNRKVVYSGTPSPSVGALYDAARGWAVGERNVPPWLTMPVFQKASRKAPSVPPPHVSPLGMIGFTRVVLLRDGRTVQEVGLSAGEAMALFLDSPQFRPARQRVLRSMKLVLARRSYLAAGSAHALRRGFGEAKKFDRYEALRTATILGVLLHKLGLTKEKYMTDSAFRLGQLLAAADQVHVGYCADVRKGDLPPSLLGNQVFSTAQDSPTKALSMLCRRWKPYSGWAVRAGRELDRIEKIRHEDKKDGEQRYWDIRKALRQAREVIPLANDLKDKFAGQSIGDEFRAQLLLGYMAGLPKADKSESGETTQATGVAK